MYPINFYTNAGQGTGYGGSAEFIASEMEKSGKFDVSLVFFTNAKKAFFTKKSVEVRKKIFKVQKIAMTYGVPHNHEFMLRMPHAFKVGFTMWETDKLPDGVNWYNGVTGNSVDILNKLDLLLVPCEHNKKLYQEAGVTIPIEVVHLGVDVDAYPDLTEDRKERRERDKTLTFLMSGDLTQRKNPGAAITAFMRTFGTRQDVKLIMKTSSGTLRAISFPRHNIEIIDEMIPVEKMRALYGESDVFVFPSRGEGFGLTPLEAMSTGMYAIYPDHTGMSEYANPEVSGVLKKFEKTPAPSMGKDFLNCGNWYEQDIDELSDMMKYCDEHREEVFALGEKSVEWARKFNYERTADMIYQAIEKHYDPNKGN